MNLNLDPGWANRLWALVLLAMAVMLLHSAFLTGAWLLAGLGVLVLAMGIRESACEAYEAMKRRDRAEQKADRRERSGYEKSLIAKARKPKPLGGGRYGPPGSKWPPGEKR